MLSFLVLNKKNLYFLIAISPESEGWRISWEKKTTLCVHQTLMFREKPYNMESFGKQTHKKLGNSLVKTQWVWRKKCTLWTAYSMHLNTWFCHFPPLESTFRCRSHTRMECCPSSPRCPCTTCISCCPSPSTDTSTSAPISSPSAIWEASQVRDAFRAGLPAPAQCSGPYGCGWVNPALHCFPDPWRTGLVDFLLSRQPNLSSSDRDMNRKNQGLWNQTNLDSHP